MRTNTGIPGNQKTIFLLIFTCFISLFWIFLVDSIDDWLLLGLVLNNVTIHEAIKCMQLCMLLLTSL